MAGGKKFQAVETLQVRREKRGKRGGGGWLGLHVEESRLRIRVVSWAEWARK